MADVLGATLQCRARAGLVVSGGSTPVTCFEALSRADVAWERVEVTLTDERCVPVDHADSNERQVRERLLIHQAAGATFVPLQAAALDAMPKPFACALIGMGDDGHFASLFPDAANLAAGLDLNETAPCLPVVTGASPHRRMSMTLSLLVRSELIVVLAFGEGKRRVLEAPGGCPVGRLLAQQRAPVRVIWAP